VRAFAVRSGGLDPHTQKSALMRLSKSELVNRVNNLGLPVGQDHKLAHSARLPVARCNVGRRLRRC